MKVVSALTTATCVCYALYAGDAIPSPDTHVVLLHVYVCMTSLLFPTERKYVSPHGMSQASHIHSSPLAQRGM